MKPIIIVVVVLFAAYGVSAVFLNKKTDTTEIQQKEEKRPHTTLEEFKQVKPNNSPSRSFGPF